MKYKLFANLLTLVMVLGLLASGAMASQVQDASYRWEVVTSLWEDAGKPTPQIENPFTDVTSQNSYYEAVLWAAEQGVTLGNGDGTFRPEELCTAEHLEAFTSRYEALEDVLYAHADSWAYWADGDGDVDCFFIAPTVYSTQDDNYLMDMDDEVARANFLGATNMEKGLYDKDCIFYAPYYTQVALEVYVMSKPNRMPIWNNPTKVCERPFCTTWKRKTTVVPLCWQAFPKGQICPFAW